MVVSGAREKNMTASHRHRGMSTVTVALEASSTCARTEAMPNGGAGSQRGYQPGGSRWLYRDAAGMAIATAGASTPIPVGEPVSLVTAVPKVPS